MKKSKFILVTLLIAFFSLCFINFGSNNQSLYAAEVTAETEAETALSNLPEQAIISFPVTYESAHGYTITWEVTSGQEYARYDSHSHWVEIERSTEEDRTIKLTVTVEKGEETFSKESGEILIPKGFTAAPVYSISYVLNDGTNHSSNPTNYKLGQKTFKLENPTRNGYTFKGWYDNAEFTGEKIEYIYVGSRQNYTLYAKWDVQAISSIEIKEQPTKLEYNAKETFNPEGLVITVYYDNGTQEDVAYNTEDFEVSKTELTGNDNGQTVTITYAEFTVQTNALTVNKLTYDMSEVSWNYTNAFTYAPEESHELVLSLPTGVKVTYTGNIGSDANNYTAVATLSYDKVNYKLINIPTKLNYNEENETISLDWVINPAQIDMSQVAWNYTEALVYSKAGHTVEVKNLPANVSVEYTGNTGTIVGNYQATATFTPKANYVLTNNNLGALDWKIVQYEIDMSEVVWDYTSFTYNGQTKTVKLINLPEGLVTAEYTGNTGTNAGSYEAVATLIYDETNYKLDGLTTDLTKEWSIAKAKVYYTATPKTAFAVGQTPEWDYTYVSGLVENETTSLINLENVTATYWQGEQQVQITQLVAGAEFTAKFTGATADNYEVVINDYTGSISTVSIYFLATQTYTYNTQAQTFEAKAYYNNNGTPVEITDGTITYSYKEANSAVETNAGTYKVTVTLSGSQYGSLTSTVDFVINKAEISMAGATWNYTSAYTYDPEVTRTVSLTLPTLVTATYQNNSAKDAANYTAVATLAYNSDNYVLVEMPQNLVYDATKGTISLDWVINPAEIDMSQVAWDYTDALIYKSERHSVVVKGLPNNVTVSYEGNEATNVGKYTAKATFTTTSNYKLVNNKLEDLPWEIVKASYDMSQVAWDYTGPYTYENKEFKVSVKGLPAEGVTANYGQSVVSATKANTYTATVEFVYDKDNYELDFGQNEFEETLTWTIKKAQIDMTGVKWDYTDPFTYDSFEKEVELTELPEGVTAVYTGNTGINANTYTAKVTLTATDSENFELVKVNVTDLEWTIAKATYNFVVAWNYTDPYTYNGQAYSVAVTNTPSGLVAKYEGTTSATNAGTYEVVVTFENSDPNYNDTNITAELTWTINPKVLEQAEVEITVSGEDRNEQNESTLEPDATVKYNGIELEFEELSNNYNYETNTGTIVIELTGNYSGQFTVTFTASDFGQANLDAKQLVNDYTDPSQLPTQIGQSKVEWTNLPTALHFNKLTGALSYEKPEGSDVKYTVLALVTYGTTSAEVVEVTITITGLNIQEDQTTGIIVEGEDSDLSVSVEDNADYVVTVDGVEQETLAAYNIEFADHKDGDEVTVKIPVPEAGKGKILQVWHITNVETGAKELVYTSEEAENGEYIEFTATSFSPYVITVAPTMFEVSVNIPENGTAVLNKTSVAAGQSVTLTVDPSDGYKVSSITVNGDELELVENQYEYVIENIQEATTIVVEFEEEYTPLFNGEQVVIATKRNTNTGNYFLLAGEVKSDKLVAVDSYSATSSVKYYAENQVWTITYVDGNYYLQASSGQYLSWESSGNGNTAILVEESGKPLTITESTKVEGAYNITFVDGESTRYLSLNNTPGNDYYAFYTGTQKHELIITTNLQEVTAQEKAEIDAADVDTSDRTVESSFTLPVAGSVFGTQITWTSNNEAIVIDGENAIVTQPEGEDAVVTLTGTVVGLNETLTITVTVKALPAEGEKVYAWQLVTDASTLKVGDQIVIVTVNDDNGVYNALGTTQNGNNRSVSEITKNLDGTITIKSTAQILTLEAGTVDGTFAFYAVSEVQGSTGYLYAADTTDKNNHLKTQATNNSAGSWSIEITDGIATIKASVSNIRNWLRYNSTSNIFSCYSSGQGDVAIYKYSEVHTCQYSEPTCETPATCTICGATQGEALGHAEEINWTIILNPTCVAEGSKEGLCTVCNKTVTATIPATGEHNYSEATCETPATCTICGETTGEKTSHNYVGGECSVCGKEETTEPETPTTKTITFNLGDNGSASHNDGSSATTYNETNGTYKLAITNGSKIYTGARDAKGNSCIKLGSGSSTVGSFKFTVPDDVNKVVIYVAKYKTNTTKINVNGVNYTLTNSSDGGQYDEIVVDTSVNKTVTFTTVSGGVRAMVNTIEFIVEEN